MARTAQREAKASSKGREDAPYRSIYEAIAGKIDHASAEPRQINLNLVVRNFGPVSYGNINVRPLTIFIGPNNSGKSYVAMLLQSILTAQSRVTANRWKIGSTSKTCFDMLRKKYDQNQHKMNIARQESKKILDVLLDEEMAPVLKSQIERDFGSGIHELVRARKNEASIGISERDPNSGEMRRLTIKLNDKLSIKATVRSEGYVVEAKPGSPYYDISTSNHHKNQNSLIVNKEESFRMKLQKIRPLISMGTDPDMLCATYAGDITEKISERFKFKTVPYSMHYFPAARSGILQGHKALTASIVAHAPYVGIEPIEIPQVTGVVADFISRIILMDRRSKPFAAIASAMENELFGGSIQIDTHTRNEYPEITYQFNGSKVPLHRSSSTISEIAPLSLYLKHIVDKNGFLIIEEPEAHLHPANQLVLAKYIVRLIRSGVNILMTTHSVFLLEKLAKYMMAGSLSPKQRSADLEYGEDEFLTQGEVSAYLFERCRDGGHRTRPVDRDEEYGISQEEFVKVSEMLHRETIIINSKMGVLGNA